MSSNYRSNKLEVAGNDPIQGNAGAFAVRMSDGSVSSWGHNNYGGNSSSVQSRLKNVKALCASWGEELFGGGAFAAIVGNEDTVVCWGHKVCGDCSAVASELKQVEGICGSERAFAALKRDGTVITWGDKDHGGDSSSVQHRLTGVKAIYSTYWAFAAVLHDGSVEAWGDQGDGGLIPPSVRARLKQVKCISGTSAAFAALLIDGTVETWGRPGEGGDSSKLKESLTQVESICASYGAFAALKKNGTVVSWGHGVHDGALDRVVAISSTSGAFAAVRSDGSVASWGYEGSGGNSSSVAELKDVVTVHGNYRAFAALREDGTVVTWGDKAYGGDSSAVRGELIGVVALSSSGAAFAAQRSDGTVVTWGRPAHGGNSSSVPALRQAGATISKFGPAAEIKREGERQQEEALKERAQQEETRAREDERQERLQREEQEKERLEREREGEREREQERDKMREQELLRLRQEWEREKEQEWEQEREKEYQAKAEREAKEKEREQEWERERSRLEQERETLLRAQELWQQQGLKSPKDLPGTLLEAAPLVNGSEEFWLHALAKLGGVLDEEDLAEAASKLSLARFKQRHVGKLSRDDLLVLAKIAPAVARDLFDNQHLLLDTSKSNKSNSDVEQNAEGNLASMSLRVASTLPRIPEEELAMEEEVGEGAFSVVWRATWTRKIAVGKQRVHSMQVAVKMSNKVNKQRSNKELAMLARDLAVISGLPHQNILTVHGVCEPSSSKQSNGNGSNGGGRGGLKIVYELMSTDLAKLLQEALEQQQQQQQQQSPSLLPTHLLLRVLRDVSAGLAHLHSHGVIHRDVKPANVLLRDEQVKLCDFGSSRDLQHTIQQMSVAGTLSYMAPEVLDEQPVGRPTDVWSFGVLLFECVTGVPCGRAQSTEELVAELSAKKCLPALVQLFEECHQVDPRARPSMLNIHTRLQTLVMQEARDSQRLKEELKRAEAQDKEAYEVTWAAHYANQSHSQEMLGYLRQVHSQPPNLVVRQPLLLAEGKGSMEELEQLATGRVCSQLHTQLKAIVEECGGTYSWAPRKSSKRCVQKVDQEYGGDYGKLLDLERATGLFEQAEDMLRCLQSARGEEAKGHVVVHMNQPFPSSPSASSSRSLRVLRCKDRMNSPLSSGYRDILLNVCDVESGFIMELQLNFHKIAQIKSQSHRFYELLRVMEIKLE